MPLKLSILATLLFACTCYCHAQFDTGKTKIEPQDSVIYYDEILTHLFTIDSKECIPAAEKLYTLGKKYGDKVEMFRAACMLAAQYSLLDNEAKEMLWNGRTEMLFNEFDDAEKKQCQPIYDMLFSEITSSNRGYNNRTYTYEECMEKFDKCIAHRRETQGECSLALYDAYNYKALYLYLKRRVEEALTTYMAALDTQKKLIANVFPYLTEDERHYYWQSNFGNSVNLTKFSFQKELFMKDDALRAAYDQQLLTKGMLLNTTASLRRQLSKSQQCRKMWHEIGTLKKQMLETDDADVLQLDIDANALERELGKSMDVESLRRETAISSADVFEALGDADLAIEIVPITLFPERPFYVFLAIDKQRPLPRLASLNSAERLQQLFDDSRTLGTDLYDGLWREIIGDRTYVRNIYFAPAGMCMTFPIEHCMTDNGMLMSERYNMYRVTSTRELITNKPRRANRRAVVYGGIADASLPQSAIEADNIGKAVKGAYKPTVCKGKDATETSLKALSGNSPHLLHIATHAFYWDEAHQQKHTDQEFLQRGSKPINRYEDKQLTCSGLHFTPLPHGADDGVCTAAEISQLDLSNTDLVVLSACNTGLGQIEADGVFGLQRGFKKAGVNTLLMSLWPVNDKATMLLMSELYRNISLGKTYAEALRAAQRYVRSYGNGYYGDMRNWAGFILIDSLPHD